MTTPNAGRKDPTPAVSEAPAEFDLTPSPRVLQMLGHIEFKGWQCLAELIDNSIDAYDSFPPDQPKEIRISLPSLRDHQAGRGEVVVADEAGGMSETQLGQAVRAGYSGNDPVSRLGLFGMGFNIATARLGRLTEVWTTREGDKEWTGVRIDFDVLQRSGTFKTPRLAQPKIDRGEHGTRVRISKLDSDRVRKLIVGRGKAGVLQQLSRIYSRLGRSRNVIISVDGDNLPLWSHCVWSRDRYVQTARFDKVPAVVDIDEDLGSAYFCKGCWNWTESSDRKPESCPICEARGTIESRERKVRGWLGIQRFYDTEHYGVDFIRNGRVISVLDQSPFTWVNPDTDEERRDYPLDALHWGGRIVGQIECDFVRVSHMKDSFDTSDPNWKRVLEILRGVGPLEPKDDWYSSHPQNQSPISRLFTGYRYGRPAGLRYLIPGDTDGTAINGPPKEWAEHYWKGEADYQNDDKWYNAVLTGEAAQRRTPPAGPAPTVPSPRAPAGPGGEHGHTEEQTGQPALPVISGEYELPELGLDPIKVEAFPTRPDQTDVGTIAQKEMGRRTLQFWLNPDDPFFQEFPEDPNDLVLVELAHALSLRAGGAHGTNAGQLYVELKRRYRPDTRLDVRALGDQARALLLDLRDHVTSSLNAKPENPPELSPQELADLRRTIARESGKGEAVVKEYLHNGKYVKFMPLAFISRLVELYPERFFDDKFWARAYSSLENDDLRAEVLGEFRNYLSDVTWLWKKSQEGTAETTSGGKVRLARASASLRLLEEWKVGDQRISGP